MNLAKFRVCTSARLGAALPRRVRACRAVGDGGADHERHARVAGPARRRLVQRADERCGRRRRLVLRQEQKVP